jgi:uncharacterized protein YwgA
MIETNNNKEELMEILKKIKILNVSVSFGSNLTKIDKNIFVNNNKNCLRLSLGYNDPYYKIILGLNELIGYILY